MLVVKRGRKEAFEETDRARGGCVCWGRPREGEEEVLMIEAGEEKEKEEEERKRQSKEDADGRKGRKG